MKSAIGPQKPLHSTLARTDATKARGQARCQHLGSPHGVDRSFQDDKVGRLSARGSHCSDKGGLFPAFYDVAWTGHSNLTKLGAFRRGARQIRSPENLKNQSIQPLCHSFFSKNPEKTKLV
jgi:hypothetical protein